MLIALVVGVLVVVALVRATVKAATRTRQVSRMGGSVLRTLLVTSVIGGAQWLLISHVTDWRVTVLVLGVPAFVTSVVLVRMLTVTTTEANLRKGGKR